MTDHKVDSDFADLGFTTISQDMLERKMSKSMSRTIEDHPEYADIEKDLKDINHEEAKQLPLSKSSHQAKLQLKKAKSNVDRLSDDNSDISTAGR